MNDFSPFGWHRLSEHLVSGDLVSDIQSIEQMIEKVKYLGLEPIQLERIREAVKAAIQGPKRNAGQNLDNLAILIRFWVPNDGIANSSEERLEDQADHSNRSNGPGFFIFQKTVGELENPWMVFCQLVNVLIYRK